MLVMCYVVVDIIFFLPSSFWLRMRKRFHVAALWFFFLLRALFIFFMINNMLYVYAVIVDVDREHSTHCRPFFIINQQLNHKWGIYNAFMYVWEYCECIFMRTIDEQEIIIDFNIFTACILWSHDTIPYSFI